MIVSNATPLISFARIEQLDLLRHVVRGHLVVPEAVALEISEYRGGSPFATIDLSSEAWIDVVSVEEQGRVTLLLPTLDRGEAEVLALGLERRARLLLLDELVGRRTAELFDLPVTGSVGLLIRAKERGLIAAVAPHLEQMRRRGVHFGQSFVDAVLRSLGEA